MGVTSIRLNAEIEEPLEELASKLDRSKNYLINQAVKEFINRQAMEEVRWQDTVAALESVQAGKTIAEADVQNWLNSWGTEKSKQPPSL